MKKWRGSPGAKFAAWVLITLCGIAFAGSCLLILTMHRSGIYDYISEETFRRKVYEEAATQYSLTALNQYLGGSQEEVVAEGRRSGRLRPDSIELNDTYFRYGIIKAETIDDVDFNSGSAYVQNNFTGHVDEEKLYRVSCRVNENWWFSASDTLLGGYSIYSEPKTLSIPIYHVCYNVVNGIFYYEGSGSFYPVRYVDIRLDMDGDTRIWHYEYDFDRAMYHNLRASEQVSIDASASGSASATGDGAAREIAVDADDTTADGDAAARKADQYGMTYRDYQMLQNEIATMLSEEYVTFQWFDGVLGNDDLAIFDGITLDDVEYQTDDGPQITYEILQKASMTDLRDYWIEDDGAKTLNYIDESADETYWVVSLMPEEVAFGWSSDLFMQANMLVKFVYGLRYGVYVILFLSLGIGVFLFVWLLAAAGHRAGTDEIVPCWLDTIPFDLFLILAIVVEWLPALFISLIGIRLENEPARIVLPLFLFLVMCWGLLYMILNFAVRIKLGAWWKNTVVWKLGHRIIVFLRAVVENLPLLWKAVAALLLLSAAEFFVVIRGGFGPIARFWLLEKVILVPLFLLALIQMQRLKKGAAKLAEGELDYRVQTEQMFWEFRQHGENLNSISSGMQKAVAESVKSERFRTELITNVSHDIKTPLTSIINYVDLLGKVELANETAEEYLEVLARQSNRLKKLIEDLMEASKASTGNLTVNLERLEAGVSMTQTVGEFEERLTANQLELLVQKPEEPVCILADARHLWRVIDNLMNNICKYAQPGTRVYIDLKAQGEWAVITFRNTSKYELNISAEELMERFVRGDSSRNTEGSGLGLSIARSLMELMNGSFEIHVDGDLFKVIVQIPLCKAEEPREEEAAQVQDLDVQ